MKRIYFIFLLLIISQNVFSQTDNKIKSVGKLTSELLINKQSIDTFKYAIKIKSLYPDEDFSEFEDSPAEVILEMLHYAELELPETWNNLIKVANRLKINENSEYISSYNQKISKDSYIVSSVIKSQSKYFVFSYNLMEWDKEIYIFRFYKEIKEFQNIEEIELNPFIIIDNELEKEINELEETISHSVRRKPPLLGLFTTNDLTQKLLLYLRWNYAASSSCRTISNNFRMTDNERLV